MRIGPLGGWEILIILVVVLLIFGSSRLPKIARGLGESARELRKGFKDLKSDIESDDTDDGSSKSGTSSAGPSTSGPTTSASAKQDERERPLG